MLDENGTGLQESDITLSTGASLVELTGDGVTWEAVIRPPETAGTLTITIAADAFTEGNVETSKDIRISTSFPDVDAEVPTEIFSVTSGNYIGVSSTRIIVATIPINTFSSTMRFYDFSGAVQTSEQLTLTKPGSVLNNFGYINNSVILGGWRYDISSGERIQDATPATIRAFTHTRLGFIVAGTTSFALSRYGMPTTTDSETLTSDPTNLAGFANGDLAHQDDLLYLAQSGGQYYLAEITPQAEINLIARPKYRFVGKYCDLSGYVLLFSQRCGAYA